MDLIKRVDVTLYTDGSCYPNPGKGGWAAVLISGEKVKKISGSVKKSTNMRMELMAFLKAIECLKIPCNITLVADSKYLGLGVTEWLTKWRNRGWKKPGGQQIDNLDIWQKIDYNLIVGKHKVVEYIWVKGHTGVLGNEMVDEMAKMARKKK